MSVGISIATGVLKFLDICVWVVTLGPLWMVTNRKNVPEGTNSEPVEEVKVAHEGPPRIRVGYKNWKPLCSWDPEASTVLDIIMHTVRKFASHPAQGSRFFESFKDIGERFPVKQFGPTKWITYSEMGDRFKAFGAFLRSIGNTPQPADVEIEAIQGPHSLVIYEDTCAEWAQAAFGTWSQNMIVTTVYGTLGPDSVAQAIQEGNGTTVFCNRKNVSKLIEYSKEMPTLKHIIYTNEAVPADEASKPLSGFESSGITVHSFDDALKIGQGLVEQYPMVKPNKESLAIIMYTSGTTGKPKGVMMRHRSVVAVMASVVPIGTHALPPNFTHLSYLPLAHIFEMAVQIGCMSMGARIGYADPKTLTQTGARPIGALEEFRPHLFMGVPKVYDVIMKAAGAKLKKESPGKQQLVASAFEWKARAMESGRYTPVFDMLIFNKFKHILGGNVVLALSGGGPLAATVQRWVRTAFGCQVIQGYGLTETCAGATLQLEHDFRPGVVGPPIPGLQISLRSCVGSDGEPEVLDKRGRPYLNTDTEDSKGNPCLGRGEILIRGPTVTDGYYKLPEKTAEAFRKDGWFLTGDVGVWYPDGSLGIMDRVKNLVKLHGGEYIAMENMELIYGGSQYVDAVNGGIMTYGDGTLDRPVALVQVSEPNLTQWAKSAGISFQSIQDLVTKPEAEEEVLRSLMECHKSGGLTSIEKLAGIGLVCDPWTAQNKCLTATNKISRHAVIARDGELLEKVKDMVLDSMSFGVLSYRACRPLYRLQPAVLFTSASEGNANASNISMTPQEVAFLFDKVSRNKAATLNTWNTKFAVTNKFNKRLAAKFYGQSSTDPSMVGRILNDLSKLDSLDDTTSRILCRSTPFDECDFASLTMVINALARTRLADPDIVHLIAEGLVASIPSLDLNEEHALTRLVQALSSLARLDALTSSRKDMFIRRLSGRISALEPFQLSMLMHALVVPDWGDGPIEHCELLLKLLRVASKARGEFRFLELREILTCAYALQAAGTELPRDIVLFMAEAEHIIASEGRKAITKSSSHVEISPSKFQDSIKSVLVACGLEYKEEVVAGPYILDYTVGNVAIEADGFSHFYSGTEKFTAKAKLKHRILTSLGWHVVSLPYFEMKNRGLNQRVEFFVAAIENQTNATLAQIRKLCKRNLPTVS
ncbi:Long-chain-fatty-acid--CoA ligase 3 [Perkinsus chesapeaki]|uniref:Long-chain-fatty-acid--CoA ligase 3 n=1 Tax=Perkinsus chesapeaki TaxID=330153 RepID=A0A7J6M5Q2_PERCH|nr:Long-chain-fatty-acid--CoA ligase 3 [Perkinsus chesapeaki]